jgi:hypothetical protein
VPRWSGWSEEQKPPGTAMSKIPAARIVARIMRGSRCIA